MPCCSFGKVIHLYCFTKTLECILPVLAHFSGSLWGVCFVLGAPSLPLYSWLLPSVGWLGRGILIWQVKKLRHTKVYGTCPRWHSKAELEQGPLASWHSALPPHVLICLSGRRQAVKTPPTPRPQLTTFSCLVFSRSIVWWPRDPGQCHLHCRSSCFSLIFSWRLRVTSSGSFLTMHPHKLGSYYFSLLEHSIYFFFLAYHVSLTAVI